MAKKLRLGILFGGRSAEHDVSLVSARNIMAAADPSKYEIVPIGISKQGQWRIGDGALRLLGNESSSAKLEAVERKILKSGREVIVASNPGTPVSLIPLKQTNAGAKIGKLDVVFPVLHGTFGEDGTVQGLLELAGIAYVGAGVLGSAAGMDKDVMKRLFHARDLPIVPYLSINRSDFEAKPQDTIRAIEQKFRYPVFVKPANLGSSVGVNKAGNRKELRASLEIAASFDRKLLVERAVDCREIECSVLGNDHPIASIPGEIAPSTEFYDYTAKYIEDTAKLIVPAKLSKSQVKQVQTLAIAAFQATDCAGMARVDLFLEKRTGKFYVNELNTIPGFTSISMYPRLWEASGIPYSKLIDRLVELAIERHQEKLRTKYTLDQA